METIRVLLADDHAIFREGLRVTLDRQSDITVVGQAKDGVEATKMAQELAPDIVIMDINMPVRDGIEASRLITTQNPRIGIIILTLNGETEHVFEILKAGVRGYVRKSTRAKGVIEAIRTVYRGGAVLAPDVTSTFLQVFRHLAGDSQKAPATCLDNRETEILYFVAQGKSNKDIADLLCLSDQTIKNRLSGIYRKLKVTNRAEAVSYAIQQGLISF